MIRKLWLPFFWFPVAFILILCNMKLLTTIENSIKKEEHAYILSPLGDITPYHLVAGGQITNTSRILGAQVVAGDARGKLLHEFLGDFDSPLAPHANFIVEEADKNGIDFRLVVAIAMCESNLGKYIPKGSFNAWGAGVWTGQQTGIMFTNWEDGIRWESQYLKERYIDKGFTTLRQIGAVYAPPSVETGHSWSHCVEEFQKGIY